MKLHEEKVLLLINPAPHHLAFYKIDHLSVSNFENVVIYNMYLGYHLSMINFYTKNDSENTF